MFLLVREKIVVFVFLFLDLMRYLTDGANITGQFLYRKGHFNDNFYWAMIYFFYSLYLFMIFI